MKAILTVLIVLYNQEITGIRALSTLLRFKAEHQINILIMDNSDDEAFVLANKQYSEESTDFEYICNGGNIGLPKCYNYAFQHIDPQTWIMIADDDTDFSDEYLSAVMDEINHHKTRIITGIVKTLEGTSLSPKVCENNRFRFIHSTGNYQNIYAINSGLTISVSFFRSTKGFDEKLFLDMVDHDFMRQLIQSNANNITVVDGTIIQDYSGNQREKFRTLYHRYKSFCRDYCYFAKKHNLIPISTMFTLAKRFIRIVYLSV